MVHKYQGFLWIVKLKLIGYFVKYWTILKSLFTIYIHCKAIFTEAIFLIYVDKKLYNTNLP